MAAWPNSDAGRVQPTASKARANDGRQDRADAADPDDDDASRRARSRQLVRGLDVRLREETIVGEALRHTDADRAFRSQPSNPGDERARSHEVNWRRLPGMDEGR